MTQTALPVDAALPQTRTAPVVLTFTVHGTPAPAGSKRAFFRGGRAIVVDANKKARPWKDQVAQVAGDFMGGRPLLAGPLELRLCFYVKRPKAHMNAAGRAKPSAPWFPTTKPDVLKLARGVEDALSGVIYFDDAQIVTEVLEKRYGPECVEIEVREL